ncbi:MAG: hypothetical protein M1834_000945 [Cirrosporium novae-zelandiae]|nr:MAG: hypothetical protein M1834_000945 [Cirrosporium novae-zelandiae]
MSEKRIPYTKWPCPYCFQCYPSPENLRQHLKTNTQFNLDHVRKMLECILCNAQRSPLCTSDYENTLVHSCCAQSNPPRISHLSKNTNDEKESIATTTRYRPVQQTPLSVLSTYDDDRQYKKKCDKCSYRSRTLSGWVRHQNCSSERIESEKKSFRQQINEQLEIKIQHNVVDISDNEERVPLSLSDESSPSHDIRMLETMTEGSLKRKFSEIDKLEGGDLSIEKRNGKLQKDQNFMSTTFKNLPAQGSSRTFANAPLERTSAHTDEIVSDLMIDPALWKTQALRDDEFIDDLLSWEYGN